MLFLLRCRLVEELGSMVKLLQVATEEVEEAEVHQEEQVSMVSFQTFSHFLHFARTDSLSLATDRHSSWT